MIEAVNVTAAFETLSARIKAMDAQETENRERQRQLNLPEQRAKDKEEAKIISEMMQAGITIVWAFFDRLDSIAESQASLAQTAVSAFERTNC
jgi:hypothetical protein